MENVLAQLISRTFVCGLMSPEVILHVREKKMKLQKFVFMIEYEHAQRLFERARTQAINNEQVNTLCTTYIATADRFIYYYIVVFILAYALAFNYKFLF